MLTKKLKKNLKNVENKWGGYNVLTPKSWTQDWRYST